MLALALVQSKSANDVLQIMSGWRRLTSAMTACKLGQR